MLHHRNLREADRVLTLFTWEKGKIEAVAKGVRKPRSKLLAGTHIFSHNRFMLYQGKTLDGMTQYEIVNSFAPLRDDMEKMVYAGMVCEFLDKMTAYGEPHPELFSELLKALTILSAGEDMEKIVWAFILKGMGLLGFAPELTRCVVCGEEQWAGAGRFSVQHGGAVCPRCREQNPCSAPLSPETRQVMRFFLQKDLGKVRVLKVSEAARREIGHILRRILTEEHHVHLKSLDFLDSMPASFFADKGGSQEAE